MLSISVTRSIFILVDQPSQSHFLQAVSVSMDVTIEYRVTE